MQPRLLLPRFKTQIGQYETAEWAGKNESGWVPIGDKVLVYPDQAPEQTAGGIHITPDLAARHTMAAEAGCVIELGSDVTIPIKPGDRVFIERFAGQLAPGHDGKIYRLMDQSSIGAIYRPTPTEETKQ